MLSYILKTFTGSFFRVLGRFFAWLFLGILIVLLLNYLDLNILNLF